MKAFFERPNTNKANMIICFIGMDLSEYLLKIDHFDKMHVLKDEGKIEGAPNFRQVSFG